MNKAGAMLTRAYPGWQTLILPHWPHDHPLRLCLLAVQSLPLSQDIPVHRRPDSLVKRGGG